MNDNDFTFPDYEPSELAETKLTARKLDKIHNLLLTVEARDLATIPTLTQQLEETEKAILSQQERAKALRSAIEDAGRLRDERMAREAEQLKRRIYLLHIIDDVFRANTPEDRELALARLKELRDNGYANKETP